MLESNLYELLETTEEMNATKKAQTLEENKPAKQHCHHVPWEPAFGWEAADQDTCSACGGLNWLSTKINLIQLINNSLICEVKGNYPCSF